jgi:hypothetical protein
MMMLLKKKLECEGRMVIYSTEVVILIIIQ